LPADNIAPPIAACLGDLIIMTLLGAMLTFLILGSGALVPFLVIGVVVLWAIACAYVALQNEHVSLLLKEGWTRLLGSMVITSASGIVLDLFVSRYEVYALLAVAFGGAYCTLRRRTCPLIVISPTCRHSRRHGLDFRIVAVDGLACAGISYALQRAASRFGGCGSSVP
jgi:hypothetical protein